MNLCRKKRVVNRGSVVQVVEKFGCWVDARHEQTVAGTGAGDVEQVALAVVDLLEIGIVCDRLDAITLPERAPGAAVEAGPGFLVYFGPEGGLQRLIGVGRGAEKKKA